MSSKPIIANNTVYISNALGGSLRAISLAAGKLSWKTNVPGAGNGVLASPIILGRQVIFGDGSGEIIVANASDGTVIRSLNLGSAIVDLQSCGSSFVVTTWGKAVKLAGKELEMQKLQNQLTIDITSELAVSSDRASLIAFDGVSPVTINCSI